MQIICTTFQTDNHASTPSLIFYGPDGLPDAQPTVSKHWRQFCVPVDAYLLTETSTVKENVQDLLISLSERNER